MISKTDLNDTHFGLDKATFDTLKEEVTMIQCCGWLVDFNQPVQHFERECIRNLYNMIRFAYRENNPMHVHVVSSISTTANYPEAIVPESAPPHDPHVALPMGYAQSKYIVEHIFAYLAENKGIPCFVERVGQLCGDTMYGSWNASEQYPLMMIGGAIMKMMPDLPFKVDWLPTDTAASAIYDIMIHSADNYHDENFFNVVNPRLIPWSKVLGAMKKCGMKFDIVSPQRWVDELRKDQSNPAYRLLWFYESNWLSTKKGPVWTTENAVTVSDSLEEAATFNSKLLSTCVSVWRGSGFLKE
ncbi:male sterility protein-domain-containing protein [Fennellomyces sp. T-0311]|nr:male sterility protein-domain-containing protein [Fennellomyces sp. T-0311]